MKTISTSVGITVITIVAVALLGTAFVYQYYSVSTELKTTTAMPKTQTLMNNNNYLASIETITKGTSTNYVLQIQNKKTGENKIINDSTISSYLNEWMPYCTVKSFSPDNKYLLIDCGTGPLRIVKVVDINAGKIADAFSSDRTYYWSDNDTIVYWESVNKEVTSVNCPDLNKYLPSGGLSAGESLSSYAVMLGHFSFNLSTSTLKDLGEYDCSPIQ